MEDTAVERAAAGPAPAPARSSRRSLQRGRQVPRTVWSLTALHVGLLVLFSLLYPPFYGFDETQHVDAVLSIRHGDGWPAPQERELSEGTVAAATPVLRALSDPPFSDDDLLPRGERPSFAELGVERDSTGQALPNQMTQHPPLYYAVGAAVLAVVPGSADWPFDRTVGVLRLVSVLMMAPLPLLAWLTATALGASRVAGLTAAALPLSVPQLHRVGGNVNNDALYTLLFALSLLLLVRVAGGDVRRSRLAVAGVVVGLALLSKGFALVLPLALGLSVVTGGRRAGLTWARSAGAAFVSLVVAFVVGGWWWLRNLVLYGTLQPQGWPQDVYRRLENIRPRPPGTPAPVDRFLGEAYELLSTRFWGELGISYRPPSTYPHWLTDVLVAAVLLALVAAVVRPPRGARPALVVAVLVPFACTLGIVLWGIWSAYRDTLSFPGAQGRYLFGSLPALCAAVALGVSAVTGPVRRVLPLLALLLALGMQAVAVRDVLSRYWLPPYDGQPRAERYEQALDGIALWAPWPSAVTVGVLVLTGVAAAAALAAVATSAVRPDGRRLQPA